MAGWTLYVGEAVILPIFPTAVANYLTYFIPLSDAGRLATQIGLIAVVSVARLSYAMASDGLLPRPLAAIHRRFATPHVALLLQAVFGFIMLRLLDLTHLIGIGMFLIGLCYAATGLAALRLIARNESKRLPIPGLKLWLTLGSASGLYLSAQAPTDLKLVGLAGVGIGAAGYLVRRAARGGTAALGADLTVKERQFVAWARQRELWLLASVRRLRGS
ncbi:MAG TPA: amino acid permease [Chloroflexota bacterium]|nr:amino acid permease [Chloroflexota bacterium]